MQLEQFRVELSAEFSLDNIQFGRIVMVCDCPKKERQLSTIINTNRVDMTFCILLFQSSEDPFLIFFCKISEFKEEKLNLWD